MKLSKFIVSADTVIFGYYEGTIYVPLFKREETKNEPFPLHWSLAGGPIQEAETLEEACRRKLEENLKLKVEYLEQLYTFGEPSRDPRSRAISVAYLALIRLNEPQLADEDKTWFTLQELPRSNWAFDHKQIVATAIKRLKSKVTYEPIGINLLGDEFSIPQLQSLYESILERTLDRRNFAKKIHSFELLTPTQTIRGGRGRPTQLYRFDASQYDRLQKDGFVFEI